MKRSILLLLLLPSPLSAQYLDIPESFRQENWNVKLGPLGIVGSSYSCVYASSVSMLRWHGLESKATHVRRTYYGGQNLPGLIKVLEHEKLRYDYCDTGDVEWLEWAIRNRLVVGLGGIPYRAHALNLVGITDTKVIFLNNLSVGTRLEHMDKKEFYAEWKEQESWGWVLVYTPPPPMPLDLVTDE